LQKPTFNVHINHGVVDVQIRIEPTNKECLGVELAPQNDVSSGAGSGKESGEGKRDGSDASFAHGAEEAKGRGEGSSEGVGANESGP